MKVVITDKIDIDQTALEQIKKLPAEIFDDTLGTEDEIINRIRDAEVITANYVDITPRIIDACSSLKFIVVPAVGFEWVDYKYAASKGIKVINCPTHNSLAVAEHAIALLFAVSRKVCEARDSMRNGQWQSRNFRGLELHGKNIGLVGYGNIGKNIADMASGLGMNVSHLDSKSTTEELNGLLKSSDIVVICASLNDSTRNLLSAERLGLMKQTAILINVARGAIVDQQALVEALTNKRIAGAGLDVFTDEPLTGTPLQQITDIAKLPNVVATPHIGYNTEETAYRLGEEVYSNLVAILNNKPVNVVN